MWGKGGSPVSKGQSMMVRGTRIGTCTLNPERRKLDFFTRRSPRLELASVHGLVLDTHAIDSLEYEYYQSLSYKWALDLLLFLLERWAIWLKLAGVWAEL